MATRRVAKSKRSPEQRAVAQARRKLEKAQEDHERWIHQRDQYALNLQDAERSLGEKVIGGVAEDAEITRSSTKTAVKEAADHIQHLRTETEAAERAVEVAEKKIDRAQRTIWDAEADEMIARARKLRLRAERRQTKTDELLEQLKEYEGITYIPEPPPARNLIGGQVPDATTNVVHVSIPKTHAMIREAEQLEFQAQQLKARAADTPERRAEIAEHERQRAYDNVAAINADNEAKRRKYSRQSDEARELEEELITRGAGGN